LKDTKLTYIKLNSLYAATSSRNSTPGTTLPGTAATIDPTLDTDGDGVPNAVDGAPLDPDLSFPRVPEGPYAVIDLELLGLYQPTSINDSGQILGEDSGGDGALLNNGAIASIPTPSNAAYGNIWYDLSNSGQSLTYCLTQTATPDPRGGSTIYYFDSYYPGIWSPSGGLHNVTAYNWPGVSGVIGGGVYTEADVTKSGYILGKGTGYGYTIDSSGDASSGAYQCGLTWSAYGSTPTVIGDITYWTATSPSSGPPTSTYHSATLIAPVNENTNQVVIAVQQRNIAASGSDSYGYLDPTDSPHPIIWQSGSVTTLPFNNNSSEPLSSINNLDPPLITGQDGNAVLWVKVGGTWKEKNLGAYNSGTGTNAVLGTYGGPINDRCEIIFTTFAGGVYTSYLWQNQHVVDLSTRTPSGWSSWSPFDLNDSGCIVGSATADGTDTAYSSGSHGIELLPAELAVDANRDGTIVMANEYAVQDNATPPHPVDTTSAQKPFRFWLDGLKDNLWAKSDPVNQREDSK